MRQLWASRYPVASHLVDYRKELSLYGLLSLIQEAAWEHAEQLGYGYAALTERNMIWALIRQQMHIDWWPSWGQSIEITTWLRPLSGLLVTRDLEFRCQGDVFCQATAQYLMLDQQQRHPRPAPMQAADFYIASRGPHDPEKIRPSDGLSELARFSIRTSDLDMHAHVNNTRIGQWITDSVPAQAHDQQRITDYAVDFQAEMHAHQTIAIEAAPRAAGQWHFQGRRLSDQKIVFCAQVTTAPR